MLELGKFVVEIKFEETSVLPEWKGNFIRGLFGKHLREICCRRGRNPECRGCPHCRRCPYYGLFEASAPPSAKYLSKLEGIPRPFVISETGMRKTSYEPGESASFGIVLVGSGLKALPVILGALQRLGDHGMSIGHNRGKFRIERVYHEDLDGNRNQIFENGKLNLEFSLIGYEDFGLKVEPRAGKICLNFLTPTQIKAAGQFQTPPEFRSLVSRIGFRVNALANYYSGKLAIPEGKIKQMLKESESARIAGSELEILHDFLRVSHERVTRHHMFFRGKVWYEGEFSKDVMALLHAGSWIHVGKYAGFGCGEYQILD